MGNYKYTVFILGEIIKNHSSYELKRVLWKNQLVQLKKRGGFNKWDTKSTSKTEDILKRGSSIFASMQRN